MLLASYTSTRPGIQGIANRLIRWRLDGRTSHSEIVFQPWDGVDDLMPDGSAAPDADGALWCVSSVAAEHLPAWSRRRAGCVGGVRFKRIRLDPARWETVPVHANARRAAIVARQLEGDLYDWQGVAGFLAWLIPQKADRWSCAELCAHLAGIKDAWRFDPCVLHAALTTQAK